MLAIPNYGAAALLTGQCNDRTILAAAGTFISNAYPSARTAIRRPAGVSIRSLKLRAPTPARAGSVTVALALARGASYPAGEHRVPVLLVDRRGQPLGLDYTNQSTMTDRAGNISSVVLKLPAGTATAPGARAYVLADVYPLFTRVLRAQ